MAVIIEHDKRKREILEKSLALFVEEGYEDVTFQKIADRCNITRTTLYIYFKNKREIFLWSIKQLLSGIEKKMLAVVADDSGSAIQSLEKVLSIVFDSCEQNKDLFKILLPYLMQVQKGGRNPGEVVSRRIVRLQHFLNVILIRGKNSGELKSGLSIKFMYDLIFSVIESAVFRIAVLDTDNLEECRGTVHSVLQVLRSESCGKDGE